MTQMNEAVVEGVRGTVVERVRDVVSKVARLPQDDLDSSSDADLFRDLCVDSGAALDILLSLEDEFGVAIPDDSFGNARSLRAIAKLIVELERRK
jgi:acyl carrier protein